MSSSFEGDISQPEKVPQPLSKRLAEILKGAEIENLKALEQGKEIFKIKVSDQKIFNSILDSEEMVEIFGKALLQFWATKEQKSDFDLADPQVREQVKELLRDGDFSVSDSIYIRAENGKLISFLCGAEIADRPKDKDYFINAGFITPEKRKQGLAGELNILFHERKYSSISSTTTSPAAVIETLKVARENGYAVFFCGYLNGEYGKQGTKAQQREIASLSQIISNLYVKADLAIDPFKMPPNFIVVNEGQGLPPLTLADLKFKPDDPLKKTFEEDVLKVQAQFAPHPIYGKLICLRID